MLFSVPHSNLNSVSFPRTLDLSCNIKLSVDVIVPAYHIKPRDSPNERLVKYTSYIGEVSYVTYLSNTCVFHIKNGEIVTGTINCKGGGHNILIHVKTLFKYRNILDNQALEYSFLLEINPRSSGSLCIAVIHNSIHNTTYYNQKMYKIGR